MFFAFFYVLYKRTLQSLHSFAFFIKERTFSYVLLHSFQKNAHSLAFFCVLCKWTLRSLRSLHSLHSYAFFANERCILCVLKKRMQKNALFFWGLISCQKLEKERKITLCSLKERKRTMRSECKRTRCLTLPYPPFNGGYGKSFPKPCFRADLIVSCQQCDKATDVNRIFLR